MKLFILILFIAVSPYSFCQEDFEFKKYINDDLVGEKQIEIDQDSTIFETIYLGQLEMKEGSFHSKSVTYNVLSQYYSVQAAIERHGHSRLIFIDEDGKTVRIYTFNMSDELPTAINHNGLTFGKINKRYLSLPDLFCIPNGECFE
jgi:hypothetical protein